MDEERTHLTKEEVDSILADLFQMLRAEAEELRTKNKGFVSVVNPKRTKDYHEAAAILDSILNEDTDVELFGGENGSTYGDIRLSGKKIVVYNPQAFLDVVQTSDILECFTHTDGIVEINLSFYDLSVKQTIE